MARVNFWALGAISLLLAVASFASSAASVWAQSPESSKDETVRKIAQGDAFCRSNLSSAPADLRAAEVDAFCRCMGVPEAAMSEGGLADDGKAAMRSQLQQMCVGIVRKDAPKGAESNATAPTSIPASAVAPAAASEKAAPPMTYLGKWGESKDACYFEITKTFVIEDTGGEKYKFRILKTEIVNDRNYRLLVRYHDVLGHGAKTYSEWDNYEILSHDRIRRTLSKDKVVQELLRCGPPANDSPTAAKPPAAIKKPTDCSGDVAKAKTRFEAFAAQGAAAAKAEKLQTGELTDASACRFMRSQLVLLRSWLKTAAACKMPQYGGSYLDSIKADISDRSRGENKWC